MSVDLEPPVGLSVWERELFDHLVRHLDTENALIDDYDELAAQAGGHVAYLLRLIIEDEQRHHRLFEEWCNALRADAEFRTVEPQVPHLGSAIGPIELKAAVGRFLDVERADRRDLARLRKAVRDQRDVTLWDVLLEVMDLDTRKHIALLRFLERHPKA
jgi:rubrerythrin